MESLSSRPRGQTKPAYSWNGGISMSPDGRYILFAQLDEDSTDLMLVRGLK